VSGDTAPNAAERRRWNDPDWVATWLQREELTALVTDVVLVHLAPRPGEAVLDIGCGGGGLTFAVADAVTPGGRAVGADLSAPLVDLARERARRDGRTAASFTVADAQVDRFDGAPFDAATSQFGVMFFEDPVAAFANVADQVVAGGRLAFVCWQGVEANPWCVMPALSRYLPPPPPPPPGAAPIGPFTMGDAARVTGLLEAAGWASVERHPYERTSVVKRDALFRDDAQGLAGVAEAERAAAAAAMEAQLAPFESEDGTYEVPFAFHVFTARRP